jgi:hypothetical protein
MGWRAVFFSEATAMATKLEKPLRRELVIDDEPWTLTIAPEGLKLVPKGKRNGHELAWTDIISGSSTLTNALTASVKTPPQ